MKFGFEIIQSYITISEKLYYNLTYHVIPQIYEVEKGKFLLVSIEVERIWGLGEAVAAGMSRGVDSFATMYEYTCVMNIENYKTTHYTYFNVEAHHGPDYITRNSNLSSKELYQGQMIKTRAFCEKYGYKLIIVDSNLADFLSPFFGRGSFNRTRTFRNLGAALLLQNGIRRYYYSAAYNLDYK